MLLRHPGERGIGIDHYAALVVDGDKYSVLKIPGKPGSVLPKGKFSPEQKGVPGVWQKDVVNGKVKTSLVPPKGNLCSLLKMADKIIEDPNLKQAKLDNPL